MILCNSFVSCVLQSSCASAPVASKYPFHSTQLLSLTLSLQTAFSQSPLPKALSPSPRRSRSSSTLTFLSRRGCHRAPVVLVIKSHEPLAGPSEPSDHVSSRFSSAISSPRRLHWTDVAHLVACEASSTEEQDSSELLAAGTHPYTVPSYEYT